MFIFELTVLNMLLRFKSEKIHAIAALLIDDNIADGNIDSVNKFNYECVNTLEQLAALMDEQGNIE